MAAPAAADVGVALAFQPCGPTVQRASGPPGLPAGFEGALALQADAGGAPVGVGSTGSGRAPSAPASLPQPGGVRFARMAPDRSICFDDLPDPGDPAAPVQARRLALYCRSVVAAATAWPFVGRGWHSALPCRRRPDGSICAGRLVLARTEVPPEVRWACPACGDAGVIRGFEGSPSDLGAADAPANADPARVDVPLSPADLAVLRSLAHLGAPDRRTVMTALDRDPEVVVWGPPEALWHLLETVRRAQRGEVHRRRAALVRIAVAIEAALIRVA